jgi:hypothetical protein
VSSDPDLNLSSVLFIVPFTCSPSLKRKAWPSPPYLTDAWRPLSVLMMRRWLVMITRPSPRGLAPSSGRKCEREAPSSYWKFTSIGMPPSPTREVENICTWTV